MDPNHRDLRDLVLAHEELEPGDRARADAHLAACESCRALLASLQAVERGAAASGSLPELDDPSLRPRTDAEAGEAERSLLLLRQRLGLEARAAANEAGAREPAGWLDRVRARLAALAPHRGWAMIQVAVVLAVATIVLWPRPGGEPLLLRDLRMVSESEVRGGEAGWQTGEAFTLRFELSSPARVVVFHVGADARPVLLHPSETVATLAREPAGSVVLPAPGSGIEWRLEGEPGPERFVVAAGARGDIDLAALSAEAAALGSAGASQESVSRSLERLLERRVGPVRSLAIQHLP
jgi:hypothetical protein